MIVQYREGDDLLIDFLLALYKPKELHKTPDGKRHIISILIIGNVEHCIAALHFARQEQKVHPPRNSEGGSKDVCNIANKRFELFELVASKRRLPKSH